MHDIDLAERGKWRRLGNSSKYDRKKNGSEHIVNMKTFGMGRKGLWHSYIRPEEVTKDSLEIIQPERKYIQSMFL